MAWKDIVCYSAQAYCDVARSIQYSHGLRDEDVKFFLAADEPATYAEVCEDP